MQYASVAGENVDVTVGPGSARLISFDTVPNIAIKGEQYEQICFLTLWPKTLVVIERQKKIVL